MMMKKALQYEFMPSKEEEEAWLASKKPYKPSRSLVEIQPFQQVPNRPWSIMKRLSPAEVQLGFLSLSHNEALDHLFRWWDFHRAEGVLIKGKRSIVTVRDVTDPMRPLTYCGEGLFLEKGPDLGEDEFYVLSGCEELISGRGCNVGDAVELCWDQATGVLHFKLLWRQVELSLSLDSNSANSNSSTLPST